LNYIGSYGNGFRYSLNDVLWQGERWWIVVHIEQVDDQLKKNKKNHELFIYSTLITTRGQHKNTIIIMQTKIRHKVKSLTAQKDKHHSHRQAFHQQLWTFNTEIMIKIRPYSTITSNLLTERCPEYPGARSRASCSFNKHMHSPRLSFPPTKWGF
jgi:hypothetical protein